MPKRRTDVKSQLSETEIFELIDDWDSARLVMNVKVQLGGIVIAIKKNSVKCEKD